MICYIDHVRDNVLKVCSQQKFYEIVKSPRVRNIITSYRQGNTGATQNLPAFLFMGYNPTGTNRQADQLQPTGLMMMDYDHIDEPLHLNNLVLAAMPRLREQFGNDLCLALAHITPSGQGLRLVFGGLPNGDLEPLRKAVSQAIGAKHDAVTKDLSRLSFAPKNTDILYIDPLTLFAEVTTEAQEKESTESSLPSHVGVGSPGVASTFPDFYQGVKLTDIVEQLIALYGGEPQPGSRAIMIYHLASDLANITGHKVERLCQLIPDFGLPREEWMATITAQAQKKQTTTLSRRLRTAISKAKAKMQSEANGDADAETGEEMPALPERLPRLLEHLTKNVMDYQRPAMALAVFPSLAAHVTGSFRLADNNVYELSQFCALIAPQSVGKGCVNDCIHEIMADIEAEDKINRERERIWAEGQRNRKANDKGETRPNDLVIRWLDSDTTNAAFLLR
ncbi:MAG: hypothetical protein HUK02_08890, partial [Bacteroidaceae bacterium]|nr:hypothetical protein [Bacteroidaceae bacterium]MCF0199423.1 hypothetical protein [Bacteroidaceae bacterium]